MALITTKTSRLSVVDKCARGSVIFANSTDNPLVPGNAAQLAAFAANQAALVGKNDEVNEARAVLTALLAERDELEKEWDRGVALLAGFTAAATGGDRTAMLSAGFDVRGRNAPSQPLTAPDQVRAMTNGFPGKTKLRWRRLPGAASYIVEMSTTAEDDDWHLVATPTKASCIVPGAEPGKPCWFRVAGVNPTRRSPWSGAVSRPVM